RYYCWLMDIYPDVAVASGVVSARSPLTRGLRWLARFGWQHATGVIVIGRCMRDWVMAHGVVPERVHVVTNWSNETAIVPVAHEDNPLRAELGLAP
ncbi:MAG: glycosyltransferase WbuB, partial [Gammaproteobacteria bacterium]|nr:glycosyltransferase WbuB [Gammaproteobacteria bacterium]